MGPSIRSSMITRATRFWILKAGAQSSKRIKPIGAKRVNVAAIGAALFLVISTSAGASQLSDQKAHEMTVREAIVKFQKMDGGIWRYIAGVTHGIYWSENVMEVADLISHRRDRPALFCIPVEPDPDEVLDMLVRYVESRPEAADDDVGQAMVILFEKKFPCPK